MVPRSPGGLREGKSNQSFVLLRWGLAQDLSGCRRMGSDSPVRRPAFSGPNKPRSKYFLQKIIHSTHFPAGSSAHCSWVAASHRLIIPPKPAGPPPNRKHSVPKAAWTLPCPLQSQDATTTANLSFSHPSLHPHHLHRPELSLADGLKHPPASQLVGASPGNLAGLQVGQV